MSLPGQLFQSHMARKRAPVTAPFSSAKEIPQDLPPGTRTQRQDSIYLIIKEATMMDLSQLAMPMPVPQLDSVVPHNYLPDSITETVHQSKQVHQLLHPAYGFVAVYPTLPVVSEPNRSKRVRFNDSKTTIGYVAASEGEKWLSESFLSDIYETNKAISKHHHVKSLSYRESISSLMTSYKDVRHNPAKKQRLRKHVVRILKTNVRGLERGIVPELSVCRKRTQRAVLTLQHKLRRQGVMGTPAAERLLKEESLSCSQPCRQLAYRLAQADEWEASLIEQTKNSEVQTES